MKASDNPFARVKLAVRSSDIAAPTDGSWDIYSKPNGVFARSSNTVVGPFSTGGAGNMATDTLWDAKGDLAAGTGADAGAKLTVGANGTVLRADSTQSTGLRWANVLIPTIARLGSGDVTISATTNVYGSNVTGLSDLTLAAASGDTILVGMSGRPANTTAVAMKFDVCTVVSAAAVNFLSNASGTGATNGISAWIVSASEANTAGAPIPYVVASGDISGGNVTLRLTCFVSSGTRVLSATTATNPLMWWAMNLGQ